MSGFQAAAVSGSVMILVIALLRLTAGKRLPRALFSALWCAAAFRLLLPVRLPSALSVWNLTAGESRAARTAAQISEHLTLFPSLSVAPAAQEAAARLSLPVMIWAAGALLLGAYFLVGWLRFTRRFADAAPVGNETIDSCVKAFGFRRPPVIRCTTDSRAPLTYGVRRPVVLLPADLLADREALRMILTHELAHIRRRDCLRKLLFTLCLCVYWWNPVCWGMVLLANRDLELACDALTLRYLGRDRRKSYALTLLELAARQAQPHPLCSGFGKPAAEERIQAIMKAKKIPVYLTILAVVLAAAVGRSSPRRRNRPLRRKPRPLRCRQHSRRRAPRTKSRSRSRRRLPSRKASPRTPHPNRRRSCSTSSRWKTRTQLCWTASAIELSRKV